VRVGAFGDERRQARFDEGAAAMTDTLYIIGNGFDLHHGIPSSYKEFGRYLKARDHATYDVMDRYFDVNADFWAEFEERLASFDSNTLVEDAGDFLKSYGAEDWSDAFHHDYQFEINRVVKAISAMLRTRFAEWVRQLPIPAPSSIAGRPVPLDKSATYLNFNYTPSLQRLYDLPEDRILHIHGAASSPDAQLVLGHGWDHNPYPITHQEDEDTRVIEGQSIIDDYFKNTFKPTAQIIRNNAAFFAGLARVERIVVMGHSISMVDHPYFREVIRNVDAGRVKWKISYFGDLGELRRRVEDLGIAPDLVEYVLLKDF
jgi:hypothetical protein